MAAFTWHQTRIWTIKYVTIPRAFRYVTAAALSHASFTDSTVYHTASLCWPLQVCISWTWTSSKNQDKLSPHLLDTKNTHRIGRSMFNSTGSSDTAWAVTARRPRRPAKSVFCVIAAPLIAAGSPAERSAAASLLWSWQAEGSDGRGAVPG